MRFIDPDGMEIKIHREEKEGSKPTVIITVTGKLVNQSSTNYSDDQLAGFANTINSSLTNIFSGSGKHINFKLISNITVASDCNPVSKTDHVYNI